MSSHEVPAQSTTELVGGADLAGGWATTAYIHGPRGKQPVQDGLDSIRVVVNDSLTQNR